MRTESATATQPSSGSCSSASASSSAGDASSKAGPASGGRSFGEVLRGSGGGRRDEAADGSGEREWPGGFGGARDRRGFAADGELEGLLGAFRVPPSILCAPPLIARPTFEQRGGVEAAQSLADRVVERVHLEANPSGRLEFVMETKADVLGGVEIRVRIEGGQVHASFATAHPEARATLEAQLGVLREAMVAKGLHVAEVITTEPRRPHEERGRDRRDDRGGDDARERSAREER